jgi:hypothetical protein
MFLSVGQNARENHYLTVANKSFKNAENFKFLKTTLTNQNCMHEEITIRLILGTVYYHLVEKLLLMPFANM